MEKNGVLVGFLLVTAGPSPGAFSGSSSDFIRNRDYFHPTPRGGGCDSERFSFRRPGSCPCTSNLAPGSSCHLIFTFSRPWTLSEKISVIQR